MENAKLKNSLYDQIYSEKLAMIKLTENKVNVYFETNKQTEVNRLSALETVVKQRIDSMREMLALNNIDVRHEMYTRLDELSAFMYEKIALEKIKQNEKERDCSNFLSRW